MLLPPCLICVSVRPPYCWIIFSAVHCSGSVSVGSMDAPHEASERATQYIATSTSSHKLHFYGVDTCSSFGPAELFQVLSVLSRFVYCQRFFLSSLDLVTTPFSDFPSSSSGAGFAPYRRRGPSLPRVVSRKKPAGGAVF